MCAGMDRILGFAQRTQENAVSGQSDIFGLSGAPRETLILPPTAPWLPSEMLHREFQAVGFYLSAHPLDEYRDVLNRMRVQSWADFSAAVKRGASAGVWPGRLRPGRSARPAPATRWVSCSFPTPAASLRRSCFRKGSHNIAICWKAAKSVVITVQAENRPEGIGLRIQTVQSLEDEACRMQKASATLSALG